MYSDQSFVSIETNNDLKFNCPTCRREYHEHPSTYPINRLALEVECQQTQDQSLMFYCKTCVKYVIPENVLDHCHHDLVKSTDLNNNGSDKDKTDANDNKGVVRQNN